MPDEKLQDSAGIGDQQPRVLDAVGQVEHQIGRVGFARPEGLRQRCAFALRLLERSLALVRGLILPSLVIDHHHPSRIWRQRSISAVRGDGSLIEPRHLHHIKHSGGAPLIERRAKRFRRREIHDRVGHVTVHFTEIFLPAGVKYLLCAGERSPQQQPGVDRRAAQRHDPGVLGQGGLPARQPINDDQPRGAEREAGAQEGQNHQRSSLRHELHRPTPFGSCFIALPFDHSPLLHPGRGRSVARERETLQSPRQDPRRRIQATCAE